MSVSTLRSNSVSPSLSPLNIVPLSLLLEGSFRSWTDAKKHCVDYTKLAGYTLVVGKHLDKRNRRLLKYLICKRGDAYRNTLNDKERVRKRRTFKTECPVLIKVREMLDGT